MDQNRRNFAMRRPVPVVRCWLLQAGDCPISQGALQTRVAGFAASLMGAGTLTQGVVMCNQPRTVDLVARRAMKVESVPSPSSTTWWRAWLC